MISAKMDRYSRHSLYVIAAFALVVLMLASIHHVSGDGCWHMQAAKFVSENNRFPLFEQVGRNEPFWSPPLYHIISSILFKFPGDIGYIASKYISAVFGILTLIISFLTIRRMYDPKIAFYSIVFLASIPIFIDYSVLSYVESTLVFFVVLSVYFANDGKILLSGASAGLAALTKYNGLFVFPVIVYIIFRRFGNRTRAWVDLAKFVGVASLIAGPWFIRNWVYLGNPIWPFLNFIFNGYDVKWSSVVLANLFHPSSIIVSYLGFFGVPDGNYRAFSFVDIPYFKAAFLIWLISTILFVLPLVFGIKKTKKKVVLWVWLGSYVILSILYVLNASQSVSRIFLPAIPALAVFWAFGFESIRYKKARKVALWIIVFVFLASLFVKFEVASNSWEVYRKDFEWVHGNTPKDSMFVANGQCVSYNLRRNSAYLDIKSIESADYLWMNQNFKLDRRSIYSQNELELINSKNKESVYSNTETGTQIYLLRR